MSGKTELRIYHNRRFHAKPTLGNVQLTHKFLSNIVGAVLFWLPFLLFFNKLSQQPDLKLVFRHKQLEFPSRWFNFVWLCLFLHKIHPPFPVSARNSWRTCRDFYNTRKGVSCHFKPCKKHCMFLTSRES